MKVHNNEAIACTGSIPDESMRHIDTIYNLNVRSQQINAHITKCAGNTDIYEDLTNERSVTSKCVDICEQKLSILQGVLDGVECLSTRQAGDSKSNSETGPLWEPPRAGGLSVFTVRKAISENGSDQVIVNAERPRRQLIGYFDRNALDEVVEQHYR